MQQQPGFQPKHPMDRGWAWMVCLGSFTLNFFVFGGLRSMGILFIDIVIRFNANPGIASITMALMAGGFAVFSAIGNAVGTMTSMRTACLVGSVLMFIGMFFTYFATSIGMVVFFLGMVTGIGYGFIFGPCMVMVNIYFLKRRSLANGIAAGGGSFGTLLIPLFVRSATKEYGYDGMLLIFSAIILHSIPAAMLLRPIAFWSGNRPIPLPVGAAQTPNPAGEKSIPVDNRKSVMYELRGSRIFAVSKEKLTSIPLEEKKSPPEAAIAPPPAPPAGPPAPPPGPPPKITLGLAVRMFCQRLCDREMFRSWGFISFFLGVSFGNGGYITCCLFLPPYGFELWRSRDTASLLIVILGISDLVGRISGGWFADLGLVRKPFISGFCFLGAGVATLIVPFFPSFPAMAVYAVLLGLFGGTYMAQLVVILAEMLGPMKTPSALGFTMLIMGLFIIPFPPLLGFLAKALRTVSVSIRISGLLLTIGGILFCAIPFLISFQMKKKMAMEAAMKSKMAASTA